MSGSLGPGTSSLYLAAARRGDSEAVDALCRYYRPLLTRWCHGRLPRWARGVVETEDVVQETLAKTMAQLPRFENRGPGGFQAYLRRALKNRLLDALKVAGRKPFVATLKEFAARAPSPLEELIGQETLSRFEKAFEQLKPTDQDALTARLELGLTYPDAARWLGKATPDAARMAISRALARLIDLMGDEE